MFQAVDDSLGAFLTEDGRFHSTTATFGHRTLGGNIMDDTTKRASKSDDRTANTRSRFGSSISRMSGWGSLACLSGAALLLHGVVLAALDRVAPIGDDRSVDEITLVVEPVSAPIQIVADAR